MTVHYITMQSTGQEIYNSPPIPPPPFSHHVVKQDQVYGICIPTSVFSEILGLEEERFNLNELR